jgi:GntR family transcriptional regulator/MocR family aminotransferase
LASNDASGQILYVGSFSKILSPSLRVGFVAGPRGLIEQIGNWVGAIDRQGDPVTELAIVEMIESGQLRRHIKRVHDIFNHRRATLAAALTADLGPRASFETPPGGLAIWVRFPTAQDADQIDQQLAGAGLQCLSSSACAVQSKPLPAARLGFASLDGKDLAATMAILRAALDPPSEQRVKAKRP